MKLRGFSLIMLGCGIHLASAQDRPVFASIRSHYGFIIPHAPAIKPLANANPWGFQGELSKLNLSDKSWKKCHCYGRDGLSVAYFNFGDPEQLGYSIGGVYFAEGYLKAIGAIKISIRGSTGVNYVSKVHHPETNPGNRFFSSNINFFLGLTSSVYYHFSPKMAFNLGLNYNHISNAGGKQPNKGMNFPTISLGLDRTFGYEELQPKPQEFRSFDQGLTWMVGGFGSLRSANERTEKSKYPLIGFFSNVLFPLTAINGLNAGLEVSFDDSFRERLERRNINENATVVSLLGGHHFLFGDVYVSQQFGWYLFKPGSVQQRDFFQRYSGFYRIGGWGIGASLIAYGNVADHLDVRVIYFLR